MKFTTVRGVLSVAHRSPEGQLHGHSYEIKVRYRHGHDARALLRHLNLVLERLDHTTLSDEIRWAEELAEHIGGQLPGCLRVEANRELEGIYGEWEA
jgi:6-pyruvoyl-tetrahydropterin synthase